MGAGDTPASKEEGPRPDAGKGGSGDADGATQSLPAGDDSGLEAHTTSGVAEVVGLEPSVDALRGHPEQVVVVVGHVVDVPVVETR